MRMEKERTTLVFIFSFLSFLLFVSSALSLCSNKSGSNNTLSEVCDGQDNDGDGKIDEADEIIQVKYVCPVKFAPNYCNGIDDNIGSCGYSVKEGIIDNKFEWDCEISDEGRNTFNYSLDAIVSNLQPQITYLWMLDNNGNPYQTSLTVVYFKITSDTRLADLGSQLSGKDLRVDFSNEFILAVGLYRKWNSLQVRPPGFILVRKIKVVGNNLYFIIAPVDDNSIPPCIPEYECRSTYTEWDFIILPKKYLSYQMIFVDVWNGDNEPDSYPWPDVPSRSVPDFCPWDP